MRCGYYAVAALMQQSQCSCLQEQATRMQICLLVDRHISTRDVEMCLSTSQQTYLHTCGLTRTALTMQKKIDTDAAANKSYSDPGSSSSDAFIIKARASSAEETKTKGRLPEVLDQVEGVIKMSKCVPNTSSPSSRAGVRESHVGGGPAPQALQAAHGDITRVDVGGLTRVSSPCILMSVSLPPSLPCIIAFAPTLYSFSLSLQRVNCPNFVYTSPLLSRLY
jgi:hypothetical protein